MYFIKLFYIVEVSIVISVSNYSEIKFNNPSNYRMSYFISKEKKKRLVFIHKFNYSPQNSIPVAQYHN